MILLDTDVLSETSKRLPSHAVLRWMAGHQDHELWISVISVGEFERGIEKIRRSDPVHAARLMHWNVTLTRKFGTRTLPVTADIARLWGKLSHQLGNKSADLLIAATALTYGLTVATRNVRHFQPTGVPVINPFGG